jgi:HPt (histidine-containing phosphotransfer) domain-containing protein
VELSQALSRGDVTEVYFRAHTIGGTAANVGAGQIRSLAERLEAMAKTGLLEGGAELGSGLQEAFRLFQATVGAAGKG